MKSIMTALLFALVTLTSFAQIKLDSSEHLTFKGVPINGTLNEYVLKMEKSGFFLISAMNGVALLKGDFAGYKECIIKVETLNQKDLVYKIEVKFPECITWSSLSSNYNNLKELLTEKYGNPSENLEEFQTPIAPKDDNYKMFEVKMNKCKYYSKYNSESGTILLSIKNDSDNSTFVGLSYFDNTNSAIIRKNAKDDL